MTVVPRYRYIAAHLASPFTHIAELPLANVEYQKLLNAAGTFRADLKMPNIARPEPQRVLVEQGFDDPNAGVHFDDSGGTRVATPHSNRFNFPDGVWLAARVMPEEMLLNQSFISKFEAAGNQRSFHFGFSITDNLRFVWSEDGTNGTVFDVQSTVPVNVTPDEWVNLAVYAIMDDSGERIIQFFQGELSDDEESMEWVPVGDPITGPASAINNSTAEVSINGTNQATMHNFKGQVAWAEFRETPAGEVASRPDFTDVEVGTTEFTDGHGVEWTLFNNAQIINDSTDEIIQQVVGSNQRAKDLANLYKEATDEGTTCIFVLRDNVPMGCWIVWDREYDAYDQVLSISGAELTSYWRRRIIQQTSIDSDLDDLRIFDEEPMIEIAVDLIEGINDIGLQIDAPSQAGPIITREWRGTDGKNVADEIRDMSSQTDGFDYRVDIGVQGNDFSRRLIIRELLGDKTAAVAKFATNTPIFQSSRRGDLRTNDFIVLGGNEGPKRPHGRAISSEYQPILQTVVQISDEEDEERLESTALSNLDAFLSHEVVEVSVTPGPDGDISAMNAGDSVRIYMPQDTDPWFQMGFDSIVRMIGYTVSVPDTGGEESIQLLLEESEIIDA